MSEEQPPKPDPLDVNPRQIPTELTDRDNWVCWRYEWKADRDEWTKVPLNPATGRMASTTDPDTWASFATAHSTHQGNARNTDGIGFVFGEGDFTVGVDLDDCRDPDSGDLEEWAAAVLEDIPGYAEASPSGTGAHLITLGAVPEGGNRGDVDDSAAGHIEMYDSGRYFTVTGHELDSSTEIERAVDGLRSVHTRYIADSGREEPDSGGANPGVDPDTSGSGTDLSDEELIEKAKNAENGDNFARLWRGDTSGHPSHSEADLALVSHLAFWTGNDRQRIDRLFRRSGLYGGRTDRDGAKWDRDDYRDRTLDEALPKADTYSPSNDDSSRPSEAENGRVRDPTDEPGEEPDSSDDDSDESTPPGGAWLSPEALVTAAGLEPEEGQSLADVIGELGDREAAAWVWELLKRSEQRYVRQHSGSAELWGYDPDSGLWTPDGETQLGYAARETLKPINYGSNVLEQLKAQVRADPEAVLDADELGVEPGTVAVANGLLDLAAAADRDDNALRELRPDDYALAKLPVEYDPDADAAEWREFVGDVVESNKIHAVQEYVGYCLHRADYRFNRALLCVGSGSNGKSTFLNTVRALLGSDQTASKPVHKFDEENHVADLYGKLANIDADLSEGSLSSRGIAVFKRLTGGDSVDARRLYQDSFEIQPDAKHLYACNQVPDVSSYVTDDDTAFWRRWIIVRFPAYFPPNARDPELEQRLTQPGELSGILNWAIDGWARLIEQGGFTDVDGPEQTRQRWQSWGDTLDKFISECVERDPDAERITTGDAYDRFKLWCRDHGESTDVGQQKFTNTLKKEDVGYSSSVRIDGEVTRGYKSLGLSDDVPDLGDDSRGAQSRF